MAPCPRIGVRGQARSGPGATESEKGDRNDATGNEYLDTRQAAAHLDCRRVRSTATGVGRRAGILKFGGRVRYLREDLDAWVRTRRRKSTSDDGTAFAATAV